MSKSAIKALTKAQEIIAKAGVIVNLVGYVTDAEVRKNWRNADQLAALVIDSAANAFQTENSESFSDNGFYDMADAVSHYIYSNLEDWNQKAFAALNKNAAEELERLAAMVARNSAFEIARVDASPANAPISRPDSAAMQKSYEEYFDNLAEGEEAMSFEEFVAALS